MPLKSPLQSKASRSSLMRVHWATPGEGGVAQLKVPLLVEVGAGENWDEAH